MNVNLLRFLCVGSGLYDDLITRAQES
jgi:hypothetical protein